ncbi:hypothetical protein H4R19_002799 [Coemansia spiralis]|nr:hypothetical protein H4R19_002799 [Coemansia spiralis]
MAEQVPDRSVSVGESEHAEKLQSLVELFPDMSKEVVDTILFNNRGQVDATINALLGLSDPAYQPDAADRERQEELARDEAYARRLAASDLRTARHGPLGQQQQQRRPMARATSAAALESGGAKKPPSRIRDIFRRKKHAASEPPAGHQPQPRDRFVRPQRQLDSDLSDGHPHSHSASSSSSSSSGLSGLAVGRPSTPPHVMDLLGEDANSTLAAYAPLSPSKHVPRSPTTAAASPAQPASPARPNDEPHIDLDHPFDDNPLLRAPPSPSTTTNPFAAPPPLPDSNPFRARQ